MAAIIFLRESYAYVILQWKTKRLQKETGNLHLRSALDTGRDPKDLFKFSIVRPIKMLFLSPIVFLISLYMAIVYAYQYLLFTTFPRIFQTQYGFSNGSVGLTYLGTGVGSCFGLIFCGAVSDRLVKTLTERNGGMAKPEYRLPAMYIGALMVPVGLFLYGWTAEEKLHWILPMIGSGFLGFGLFAIIRELSGTIISGLGLSLYRCLLFPTWLMLSQYTLPPPQLHRLSSVPSLERCCHSRGTACTMLWG